MTPADLLEFRVLGLGVLDLALLVLVATLLPAIWRVVAGPSEADRAIAADHAFYVLIGAIALLSVRTGRPMLLDLVVVGTLIGFISAVVLARFVGSSRS